MYTNSEHTYIDGDRIHKLQDLIDQLQDLQNTVGSDAYIYFDAGANNVEIMMTKGLPQNWY